MTAPLILGALALALVAALTVHDALRPAARAGSTSAARRMRAGGKLDRKHAARTAQRLGVDSPGLTIGKTASGGRALVQGWEDCSVDLAGPRQGKTTCRVVRAILEAPGAVVTTSNKTDALDATREQRAQRGPVVVFDPQGLAGDPPRVYWDPLSYVTDEARAAELADVFAAAHRARDARTDEFFGPKGRKLVAALLLAAASSGRTIDQCYRWVVDPRDDEPADLLRDAGYSLLAAALRAEYDAPEKQRAGVFGAAEPTLAFLTSPHVLAWCTPGAGRDRLDVDELLDAPGATLYLLSREGKGSAGALAAGLTVAVCDAAERRASTAPGGRLAVPLVAVLDEACNVCRWPALPDLYSHYGSRGIVLMTFAQSWSQYVEAFGRDGARKMWSAATVKVVGAGLAEADFLDDLSRLVGDFDEPLVSTGRSRHGRSTTTATRRRRILDPSALAALPTGRAIVLPAGAPPAMARLVPFWEKQ